MHGLGNDFAVLDCLDGSMPVPSAEMVRRLCDRRKGIGADGVITIVVGLHTRFAMRIFNSDGSEAQMCGNGIRCVAKYLKDNGLATGDGIEIETRAGLRTLGFGTDGLISVDMGTAETGTPDTPLTTTRGIFSVTPVSVGNPHGVVFCDILSDALVLGAGPELESHHFWPEKANIEFAEVSGDNRFSVRVWERGAGETAACGTGACAVAVAAALTGRGSYPFEIALPGGTLRVSRGVSGHIILTGPAVTVFTGRIII